MSLLSKDELKTFIETSQKPCVSIYMPVQKAGPEVRQNPIRFKNLVREAEKRLDEMGIDHQEAMEWFRQVHDLDTGDFWEHQDGGLAIFISPNLFRSYSFPWEVQELVVVNNYFHIKPLLHLIENDGQFYLLTLNQKDVKFFEATRFSIQEVEVENMPKSLEEALQYDETAKEGQIRIATSRGGTANSFQQPGSFHGQGSPDRDKHQEDIRQFFYLIDAALHEKLRDQKAPLVVAGVEYLHPIYKEANTYPHLTEKGIPENLETVKELHSEAWKIVEPLFEKVQKEAMEHYKELAGSDTGKASHDLKEIVSSAYFQRVDSLFVPVGQQLWGHFDPETMTVDLHREPEADDEDLLDFAAIHTLLNGGKVYAMEPENVPDKPVAAIFRY
jgi:Bacterial archaeo-eukaryotic release factor family 6